MRRSLMGLVFFLAGCIANTEDNIMDNQIDISGLKHHYTQNCDGVKVNVFYSPQVEQGYARGDLEPFDKYKIVISLDNPKQLLVDFMDLYPSSTHATLLKRISNKWVDITEDQIGGLHTHKPFYVSIQTPIHTAVTAYSIFIVLTNPQNITSGHFSLNFAPYEMLRINGTPCRVAIPDMPIEVVPDGSL